MKFTLAAVAAISATLALPAPAFATEALAWRPPSTAAELAMVGRVSTKFFPDDADDYGFFVEDLNDDGRTEVLALGLEDGRCFHFGCEFAIYRHDANGQWRAILTDSVAGNWVVDVGQFTLRQETNLGFHTIYNGYGEQTWEFDGKHYKVKIPIEPPSPPEPATANSAVEELPSTVATDEVAREVSERIEASLEAQGFMAGYDSSCSVVDLNDDGRPEVILNGGCGTWGGCFYTILMQDEHGRWEKFDEMSAGEEFAPTEERNHGFRAISDNLTEDGWRFNGTSYTTDSVPPDPAPAASLKGATPDGSGHSPREPRNISEPANGSGDATR
jgi:hypothetical protein